MLALVYTLLAIAGLVLVGTACFVVLPELIFGSPLEVLMAILSPRRFWWVLRLVEQHIRDDWPETKWVGVVYYAGLFLLITAGLLFGIDLLSQHGPAFIERVEWEAARNPRVNHLLGGVWRFEMTDDVWQRVQRARRETW